MLTERDFEAHRPRLRAIAYRMLGSAADADDAVQDTWLRMSRADTSAVDNTAAWLTTVVARVCLDQLRSRRQRREVQVPDPIVSPESGPGPEEEAVLADGVSMALLAVLETLSPDQRLAFVLHDVFGVPFEEIAGLLDRSPASTRQLASRARRRVRAHAPDPDPDLAQQRIVVDAFFAAARDGNLDALVSILHPDVVLRSDGGEARPQLTLVLHGAAEVAAQASTTARLAPFVRPVLVNGLAGAVVAPRGQVQIVMAFTVVDGRVAAIDVLADPERLRQLELRGALG